MRLNRDKLWEAIRAYVKGAGGDLKNTNLTACIDAECAIDNVLNSYQLEYDRVQRELGEALTRVREKQESLREIGKACALIKNTARGDFVMLPGGDKLEIMVTEGLKK